MSAETLERRLRHLALGRRRKPFDPAQFVFRRALLIAVSGALLSIVLAGVLAPLVQPDYQTDAVLLIDPTREPTLSGRDRDIIPGDVGDWIRTQVSRVTSVDVLREALSIIPVEEWPSFLRTDQNDPGNPFRLMRRIKVRETPRTYLVVLSIGHSKPAGLAPLLNAVMEAFVAKLHREREQSYARRLAYLRDEHEKIAARLAEEERRLMELAGTVESKAFLHEGYNVHLAKVEQIQRLYWEAFSRRAEAEAQLKKVEEDREQILKVDLRPFADERVADNFGINRIEQWTYEQLQQMRASIDGLTPSNQDRLYVESRMQAMNDYLAEYKRRVGEETITNLREKRAYELETQVMLARTAVEASKQAVAILEEQLEDARKEAARTSLVIFNASGPAFSLNQLRDRLQALNGRIDDAEMEAKAPSPISIDKRAVSPVRPTSSRHKRLLPLALMLGFGSVTVLVLGIDLVDDRIRAPREVELALGGAGPDPIASYVANVVARERFSHATLDAPDHPSVRAIRELAIRIHHEYARFGGRVFLFSGIDQGCGTTSLAINTAHALTALFPEVILIEANLSRPGLRSALDLPPGPGIETALGGDRAWDDLMLFESRRGVWLLPAQGGPRPSSLTGLVDILQACRRAQRLMLVDAGCILTDDVARLAMHHADAVILVVREDVSLYRHLRQAIDQLAQARVPALTAVLNFAHVPWLNRLLDRQREVFAFLARAHEGAREAFCRWRLRPRIPEGGEQ